MGLDPRILLGSSRSRSVRFRPGGAQRRPGQLFKTLMNVSTYVSPPGSRPYGVRRVSGWERWLWAVRTLRGVQKNGRFPGTNSDNPATFHTRVEMPGKINKGVWFVPVERSGTARSRRPARSQPSLLASGNLLCRLPASSTTPILENRGAATALPMKRRRCAPYVHPLRAIWLQSAQDESSEVVTWIPSSKIWSPRPGS